MRIDKVKANIIFNSINININRYLILKPFNFF